MPERGESSDRGWRYAIFFFSPAALLVPPPFSLLSHLRHRANAAARRRALPQFFPAQSNAESISGRRASIASPSARIRGINANSCRAYLALSSPPGKTRERGAGGEKVRGRERGGKRKRERQNEVSDISLSKGWDAASKFTFVDLALFVLRDAKLDKA